MWPFSQAKADDQDNLPGSAYAYSFKTLIGGNALPLSQFKGKVLLVVNTASHCGFTPQYQALENIYNTYKAKGFVVLGVPSNDFGQQESGSNDDIANFCKVNYSVTFPMAAKETVSGKNAHPFYLWARRVLGFGTAPKWNFHKYLINRKGQLVEYYISTTKPDSDKVTQEIEKLLKESDK